jgi:hypothetical protein
LGPLLQDDHNLKMKLKWLVKRKKKEKKNLPGAQTPYIGVWARFLSVGHGCIWRVEGRGGSGSGC